jgi:hypothetical protein
LRRQSQPSQSSGPIEPKVAPPGPKAAARAPSHRAADQGKSILHYLGGISGSGILKCEGEEIARATYDFDGFFHKTAGVTGSGEIRLPAQALRGVFGRQGVQLFTDDGRLLDLRFSEKTLPSASDSAHVDVTGDLPDPPNWRR